MSGTDTGVIYAEIRLQLDKLKNDVTQVIAQFNRIPGEATRTTQETNSAFGKMGNNVTKGLKELSQTAVGQFATMTKGIQGALNALPIIGMISMVAGAVTKLISGVAKWLSDASEAYRAHQAEVGKLNALLQTTGAIAWTSTKELEAMALELSHTTNNTQDDIMKMQGVLLGFRSITGDVFGRTTKAIIDMAAVMGGDLASSANVVGKAIDTPVQGMTALSKQGFVFTQAEKDMVKQLEETGHHLEAQEIILEALEGTFAGTAQAISSASEQQNRFKTAQDELKRAQGEATSGLATWWAKVRANWTEARLAVQLARNETDKASKNIASGYKEQEEALAKLIERLEKLKKEGADAAELLQMENLIGKTELELDLEKATDQWTVAKDNAQNYFEMCISGGIAVTEENDKTYASLIEIVRAEKAIVDEKEEALEGQKKIYAETAAELDLITKENDQVVKQDEATEDILKKQKSTLEEIERIRGKDLISEEDANKQRAAAYETTVKNMLAVQEATKSLKLEQDASLASQNALQERQNTLIDEAAEAMRRYNAERNSNKPISGDDFKNERLRILQEFNNAIEHNNNLLEANVIDQEAYDREYMKEKSNELAALEQLIKRGKATTENAKYAYENASEAAQELKALHEQALTIASNNKLAEQMDTWKNKMLELGASTEQLRGLEYARMQAEITGSQASNEVKQQALAQLNELYTATSRLEQEQRDEEGLKKYNEMDQALKNMTASSKDLLENQRQQALESVQGMGLSLDMEEQLKEKINEYYDALEKKQAWDTFKSHSATAINEVMKGIGAVINLINTVNQNAVEIEIEGIDSRLEKIRDDVNDEYKGLEKELREEQRLRSEALQERQREEEKAEQERQTAEKKAFDDSFSLLEQDLQRQRDARLVAAGLKKAETVEDLEKELEYARQTLNEKYQLEVQNRLDTALINQEFDELDLALQNQRDLQEKELQEIHDAELLALQKKHDAEKLEDKNRVDEEEERLETDKNNALIAATKELEDERSNLRYKAALQQWEMQLIQGASSIAQAILTTIATTPWPASIALAAGAAGLGAVQMATINANKPRLESFEYGGIVPGSSFSGDNVIIRANSGERVLTAGDQKILTDFLKSTRIASRGSSGVPAEIIVVLNTDVIAKATVEVINNRKYVIKSRSVI
jgi:hypothetical protein